jgi:hypothetical protein
LDHIQVGLSGSSDEDEPCVMAGIDKVKDLLQSPSPLSRSGDM